MWLILRVSRGPNTGISRSLMTGQRALVGCSNWAHIPVEDSSIGDLQFLLKLSRIEATIENLSEAAMLFVNGQRCSRRKLSNGDIISVGACEFRVEIHGESRHLSHLNLPLLGSISLTDDFGHSVRISKSLKGMTTGNRMTIHPEFWSESTRLRNRGTGVPSPQMLKNISRKRSCGLIVNSRIHPDVAEMLRVGEKCFQPLVSNSDSEPLLWLLDSVRIEAVQEVVSKYWITQDALFFVPVDSTLHYRSRFLNSALWNNRNVEQITTLLMLGTMSVRESIFKFLDAVLLPTRQSGGGWILLTTLKVETQTDPRKLA